MNPRHRFFRALAVIGLVTAASGLPLGCSSGVVGGECRPGLSSCAGRCLDLHRDTDNCGTCGNVCAAGESCFDGACVVPTDAGKDGGHSGNGTGGVDGGHASSGGAGGSNGGAGGAGGTPNTGGTGGSNGGAGGTVVDGGAGATNLDAGDAAPGQGGAGGAGGLDGSVGAGGTGGNGVGGSGGGAGGAPVDAGDCGPLDVPQHCGDCNTVCTAPTSLCSPTNDRFTCVSKCTLPLVECGTQCVNTDTDENNCGKCNHRCASQICQGGLCVGATAGDEVLMCMDLRTPPAANSPVVELLANAVFISPSNPVRILGYQQYTPVATINAVTSALVSARTARNRTYALTPALTSLEVTNQLDVVNFDVLLVYDEPTAPAGQLATLGTGFQSTVTSFTRAGGIVIVLAGDGGRAEMPAFLANAGLLDVTSQVSVTAQNLYNRAPGDTVGNRVLSPFKAARETCTFTLGAPDPIATYVITDSAASSGSVGAPVVVHKVIAP